MKKFKVKIRGFSPLLQARHLTPSEEAEMAGMEGLAPGKKIKTKELTDDLQFDLHAYRTTKGKFYQPSEMFEAAMAKAAVNFKLEGKKSYKDVIKGGVLVEPILIEHDNQHLDKKLETSMAPLPNAKGWYKDARWGRNKNTGGAVWVVRPRIDDWSMSFTINLLQDERVSAEVLKDILVYAGLYVGIGAWRPKYGQFEVIKFEEVK